MKITLSWLLAILTVLLFSDCSPAQADQSLDRKIQIEKVAMEYFGTYAEREDWEKLLSFYRQDLEFKDVMLSLELDGLEDFKVLYDWPDTSFQKLVKADPHLILEQLMVNDSTAIGYGFFNPFYWQGDLFGEDHPSFAIVLTFDESFKIKRQVDLIQYPVDLLCRYYKD